MPYDGRTSPSRRVTNAWSSDQLAGARVDGTQQIFAGITSHRRSNPGDATRTKKKSVANPAFEQAHAIWLSPDMALYLDDGPRWALMHHDGRVCATLLELRRATRLGPQRAKGMLSRFCCGQKQWLSWSADLQTVHYHQKLCDRPAKPITCHGPPEVHPEVAVGCSAVAQSQARRHPFVRPWGSAIGH